MRAADLIRRSPTGRRLTLWAGLGAAALAHDQIIDAPGVPRFSWRIMRDQLSGHLATLDLTPDLGCDIGSKRWLRGFGTFLGLGAVALAFWPNFAPLEAAPAAHLDDAVRDEYRSQMILPLALGADSGRRMGATTLAAPLAAAPERPTLELVTTLARGDSLERMLRRAGVGRDDTARVAQLVGGAVPLEEIQPGTTFGITLGRRTAPGRDTAPVPPGVCTPSIRPPMVASEPKMIGISAWTKPRSPSGPR